ncbi:MAG: hypothetical protein ACK5K7_06680 [Bacilli bacterium]
MKKKTRQINCRVNEDLYERLNSIKDALGDSVYLSDVVVSALYEYVKIREGEKSLELINSHILEAINSAIIMSTKQLKSEVTSINKMSNLILLILKENLEIDYRTLEELENILLKNTRANI